MQWSFSCCPCRLKATSVDASPSLGFTVTPLLSPAVHAGRVGEVAPPPQHTNAGRKQEAIWVCLSSGPQVGLA